MSPITFCIYSFLNSALCLWFRSSKVGSLFLSNRWVAQCESTGPEPDWLSLNSLPSELPSMYRDEQDSFLEVKNWQSLFHQSHDGKSVTLELLSAQKRKKKHVHRLLIIFCCASEYKFTSSGWEVFALVPTTTFAILWKHAGWFKLFLDSSCWWEERMSNTSKLFLSFPKIAA